MDSPRHTNTVCVQLQNQKQSDVAYNCGCFLFCVVAAVTDEFKCPVTCEVMKDPVVAAGRSCS